MESAGERGVHLEVEAASAGVAGGAAADHMALKGRQPASPDDRLLATVLRLRPRQRAPQHGRHLHAAFLRAIGTADPALAAELHAANQPRPFTIAVLPESAPNGETQVYLSLLDERLIAAWSAWLATEPRSFQLGTGSYDLLPAPTDAWASATTYGALCAAAPSAEILIEFATPTCFSRGDPNRRQHLDLFPAPAWVWESWARKWARWGPAAPEVAGAATIADGWLAVADYALHTAQVDHGRYRLRGFVGWVRYAVDPAAPAADSRLLNTLAEFARYAGTGYKTTMGMGLTRRASAHPGL